jgi:hypothetical protein
MAPNLLSLLSLSKREQKRESEPTRELIRREVLV